MSPLTQGMGRLFFLLKRFSWGTKFSGKIYGGGGGGGCCFTRDLMIKSCKKGGKVLEKHFPLI